MDWAIGIIGVVIGCVLAVGLITGRQYHRCKECLVFNNDELTGNERLALCSACNGQPIKKGLVR